MPWWAWLLVGAAGWVVVAIVVGYGLVRFLGEVERSRPRPPWPGE